MPGALQLRAPFISIITPSDGGGSDASFYRLETEAQREKVANDPDFLEVVHSGCQPGGGSRGWLDGT